MMFARVKTNRLQSTCTSPPSSSSAVCARPRCSSFDAGELPLVLTPEVALFALFALVGDFLPLKVFTRGAEGEVTTSTCFAVAAMLTAGPLAALIALAGHQPDRRRPAPQAAQEDPLQRRPVRDHRRRRRRGAAAHHRAAARRPSRTSCPPTWPACCSPRSSSSSSTRRSCPRSSRSSRARAASSYLAPGPLLAGPHRRPAPRPGAGRAARRRLRAAGHRAAVPAAVRRAPRRQRGDRQGAPGAP